MTFGDGKTNNIKKELQNNIITKKRQFIDSLTILINACYFKNKNNEIMLDLKESFMAFKKIAEDIIIKNVGAYMWKYREQIKKIDDSFFIGNVFDNDITEYYKKNPDETRFTENDVAEIFSILRKTYPNLNDGEKKMIWVHSGNLLKYYAEYKLCQQKLNNMNNK